MATATFKITGLYATKNGSAQLTLKGSDEQNVRMVVDRSKGFMSKLGYNRDAEVSGEFEIGNPVEVRNPDGTKTAKENGERWLEVRGKWALSKAVQSKELLGGLPEEKK